MTSNTPSPRCRPSSLTGMRASARGTSTPSRLAISTGETYRARLLATDPVAQSMMCLMGDLPDNALIVLYDRECGFCKVILAALLRWDRAGRLAPLPIQSSGGEELLFDMTPSDRLA